MMKGEAPMSYKNTFQTTTTAEFREITAVAHAAGRLPELIEAIEQRLERHQAMLQVHEEARDYHQIREAKKHITNLENKLEIARMIAGRPSES